MNKIIVKYIAQLAGAVEYADCTSIEDKTSPTNNSKPFDGEAPLLELWGMQSTPSLPLLPGPLCSGTTCFVYGFNQTI